MLPTGIGLVVIALLAALLIVGLLTLRRPNTSSSIQGVVNEAIEQLDKTIRHHMEVNAILALMDTFEDRPELTSQLATYSRQTVAATLLYRVNSLAAQLKTAGDQLTKARQGQGGDSTYFGVYDDRVKRLEPIVTALTQQLQAAHRAVEAFADLAETS